MLVELKYAGIPHLGMIAVHYWFVTNDSREIERWEVWHSPNAGGRSNGHLHLNLLRPDSNVGGGPTRLAHQWTDAPADRIAAALNESWIHYPYKNHYRTIRGPNSNTFVAWILHLAEINYRLSWRGIGKNFATSK